MSAGSSPGHKRRTPIHALRILILIGILVALRLHHEKRQAAVTMTTAPLSLATVQTYLPEAQLVADEPNGAGGYSVFGADDLQIGMVMQTSPASDHIVGFSGPTNMLLVFNNDETLLQVEILSSRDTPDHVEAVKHDPTFLPELVGLSRDELVRAEHVDGVSGATLTSYAIREAIAHRLGGSFTSLRFPNAPTLEQVQAIFPEATDVEWHGSFYGDVFGSDHERIGTLHRTSPDSDGIIGYRGPTDTVIGFNTDGVVAGIAPAQTYDNEEYVYYVRVDAYFRDIFNGRNLVDVAATDLVAEEIEGVSGATMTSMAMARGVVGWAQTPELPTSIGDSTFALSRENLIDTGAILVILVGVVTGMTRLRARSGWRVAYSIVLVCYLGLVTGDMLSVAMFAGWAAHGVPWTAAPVLVALSVAAVSLPIATGHNIYCHHLCPHGAVQQWMRRLNRRHVAIPRSLMPMLKALRGILLVFCVLLAVTFPEFSLVQLEPFDAWVWQVAGWATITIAVVGLGASLFVPMAYCRFGCPTGYLLDLLRRHRRSDQWSTADWAATAVLVFACIAWFAA